MQDTTGTPLTRPADPEDPTPEGASDPRTARSGPRPPRTRRTLVPFVTAGALSLAADQLSKLWALRSLDDGHVVPVVGDLLSLRLIRNPGAAFSIGDSNTWVMTVVAVVVSAVVLGAAWRAGSRRWAWALGLLVGGSFGNLGDRFFREPGPGRGHVIDFVDYGGLFVGNVADIAIVLGACALIWLTMRDVHLDGSAGGRHGAKGDHHA